MKIYATLRMAGYVLMSLLVTSEAYAFSCQHRIPHPASVYLKENDILIVGKR